MSLDELSQQPVELVVPEEFSGARLDVYLALKFPLYSRVHLRRVIGAGGVTREGRRTKAAQRLATGDRVSIVLPELPRQAPVPENIPLDVFYEDEQMAVINKPPGMVVHPARGHWSGTLTGALAFHFERLSTAGGATRPGIVHRIDRDTSGVLVVAKTDRAHLVLSEQFAARTVEKEYWAIVVGAPNWQRDVVDQPIGPHPTHREKMAIRRDHPASREAQTFYEVLERFDGYALVEARPKTGRTHQIRLHLAHIGCPVLCDRLYSGGSQITYGALAREPADERVLLGRQALHARRIKVASPASGEPMEFVAPLPADIELALSELRRLRSI